MTAALLALALGMGSASGSWTVNSHRALVWEQQPYLPVGVRLGPEPAGIEAAAAAGVRDILVELPAGGDWSPTLRALEAAGVNYWIEVRSLAPAIEAYVVEPESFRVGPFEGSRSIRLNIPGATDALVVLAGVRDGRVDQQWRVPVVEGLLSLEVVPNSNTPQVLLIYPRLADARMPDAWESFDHHRDALLRSLRQGPPGPGLRGMVDPLGTVLRFVTPDLRMVPTSETFRIELQTYLEERYAAVNTALRAWGVGSNDIETFDHLARLVPLWSETRGVANFWDPLSDRLYTADKDRSLAWQDIRDVLRGATTRRTQRLIEAVRRASGVPVVQTWAGWSGPYEAAGVLNGVAFRADASGVADLIESASRPAALVIKGREPMLLMAKSIELEGDTGLTAADALRELEGLGVRAAFFLADTPEELAEVAALARSTDESAAEWSPTAVFYPEAARGAAEPGRLLGGTWWLPSPADGNWIDFGVGFDGYRIDGFGDSFFALWSTGGTTRVKLKVADPKAVTVETLDGSDPEIRTRRDELELNLGGLPVILRGLSEPPVPVPALDEALTGLDRLFQALFGGSEQAGEEKFIRQDLAEAFKTQPGAGYLGFREQLLRLAVAAAPYHWIEAENTRQHNMSQRRRGVGASAGFVLSLQTRLENPGETYIAEYGVLPRSAAVHQVWVAGRIPESVRDNLRITIGERSTTEVGPPVSYYGLGYAWHYLGTLPMPVEAAMMRLELEAPYGADLDLDAIVLTPGSFRPNGPRPPLEWLENLPLPARR